MVDSTVDALLQGQSVNTNAQQDYSVRDNCNENVFVHHYARRERKNEERDIR